MSEGRSQQLIPIIQFLWNNLILAKQAIKLVHSAKTVTAYKALEWRKRHGHLWCRPAWSKLKIDDAEKDKIFVPMYAQSHTVERGASMRLD